MACLCHVTQLKCKGSNISIYELKQYIHTHTDTHTHTQANWSFVIMVFKAVSTIQIIRNRLKFKNYKMYEALQLINWNAVL